MDHEPTPEQPHQTVRQMRLVVQADDYEDAVRFYRDVVGLPVEEAFLSGGAAEVAIFDAGRATLEVINAAQKRMIDEVEVGQQVAPRIRVAFEVDDTAAATSRLVAGGAVQLAPPTRTPGPAGERGRALRGREVADPGVGPHGPDPADAAHDPGAGHA